MWDDLYQAMATALAKRGVVRDNSVKTPDEAALGEMAKALKCDPKAVTVMLGGK